MKKKLKIYLFRHGQSEYNRDKKFTGWKDAKLTNKGRQHAKIIAGKLKNKKFQLAIHTSLSRSKDTLTPSLKFHPECEWTLEDDRMIERSYGILEGMSHDVYLKKIGKEVFDLSGVALSTKKEKDDAIMFYGKNEYEIIHRGYKDKALNGESFYDVELRVSNFISWLKKYMKKTNSSVAISAHGNSIRLFRKIMEKANIKKMKSWNIPYDKVFEYSI